jgi:hypothetical protein
MSAGVRHTGHTGLTESDIIMHCLQNVCPQDRVQGAVKRSWQMMHTNSSSIVYKST